MKLRIQAGPMAGKIVDLPETQLSIGRDPGSGLVLDLAGVSRQHARITCHHGMYRLEDLGSTNGVRVNGQTIQGSRTLINGDRIGIGDAILLFTDEHNIASDDELARMAEQTALTERRGRAPAWLPAALVAVVAVLLIGGALYWLATPPPASTLDPGPDSQAAGVAPGQGSRPAPGDPATRLTRPARPVVPPPAAPPPACYYLVQSNPPGARILFDDQPAGVTPAMLAPLARGTHRLHLSKPGYDDLRLHFLFVPADGPAPVYDLVQADGTCRIDSDPPGASVLLGARLLGRTPLVITELPPGVAELRLEAPGHAPATVQVTIEELRPTVAYAKLESVLGALEVITYPANAKLYVDGVHVATSDPASPQDFASSPVLIDGLAAGGHVVYMDCYGLKTSPQTVTVATGKKQALVLAHYLPNTTVELTSGRTVEGMLRRQSPNGDLELTLPRRQKLTVPAQHIKKATIVPFDEFISQSLQREEKQ